MLAPVYRHLDTKATFLGISFPGEWLFVMVPIVLGFGLHQLGIGFLLAVSVYTVLRVATYGQPEDHLRQWTLFHLRGGRGGRLSAAARSRQPRFPFVPAALDADLQRLHERAVQDINALFKARGGR